MNCIDVSRFLTERDIDESLPPEVAHHIGACAACRQLVVAHDAVMASFSVFGEQGDTPDVDEFTARVMTAVVREVEAGHDDARQMPLRNWLVVGALMVLGFLVLPFSEVLESMRQVAGPVVNLATALILGMVVTCYICVLVVANHHRMPRWLRPRH